LPRVSATPAAPLRLTRSPAPRVPGPRWGRIRPRLSGICGSDLATVGGTSSFYFSPLVSMPFTPGHEVVGDLLDDVDDLSAGTRVVVDPLLTCVPRGLDPCASCSIGHTSRCDRITVGHLSPGLQTGFCKDTGGGWSDGLVAHRAQLHPVPDDLPDERAVLVEPLACAVHTAERLAPADGDDVLVVGAGAVGLFTVLALRACTAAGRVTVVAKHAQQAVLARRFGATDVVSPSEALGAVRRSTRALRAQPEQGAPYLLGGVDCAVECAGSRAGVDTALRSVRAGGRVVLSGMPPSGVDLSPVWFRELTVLGSYAGGGRQAFERAMELAATAPLDEVRQSAYPLERWREALDHAADAGRAPAGHRAGPDDGGGGRCRRRAARRRERPAPPDDAGGAEAVPGGAGVPQLLP
ncbi:MAG TPA: zinc-binding dehydrogenase, partial [Mycobacteriales bacterium]|nr:zinc-binding dehydrogenase [Mycobacteriales bacterium]